VYSKPEPVISVNRESESERTLYPVKKTRKRTAMRIQEIIFLCLPRIMNAKKLTRKRIMNISSKRNLYPDESKKAELSVAGFTGIKREKRTAVARAIARFLSASCTLSSSEKKEANHRHNAQIICPAKLARAVNTRNDEYPIHKSNSGMLRRIVCKKHPAKKPA